MTNKNGEIQWKTFQNYINHLEFAQPQFIENVQILPILGKDFYSDRFGFLTDSLKKSGSAEITEVSDDGNVPKILFKNNGDRPILLIDGEELKGCKQNRVLNLSFLLPRNETLKSLFRVSSKEGGAIAVETFKHLIISSLPM